MRTRKRFDWQRRRDLRLKNFSSPVFLSLCLHCSLDDELHGGKEGLSKSV